MSEVFDVTIIGGGTTGMYAAFYSGMRDLKTKVIEYQPDFGGKVSFFYPEKKIYDVGGFPGVTGEELVTQVKDQANLVEPVMVQGEKIQSIEKLEDGSFRLINKNGGEHLSKAIIIASGMGTFDMQPLQVEGSETYKKEQVHYTIQNLKQYEEKKVVVISQSRVGIDWSLALENIADEVHLINRGEEFKAVYEHDMDQLKDSSVKVHLIQEVEKLHGDGHTMTSLTMKDGTELKVDHILVYEGLNIEKSMYAEWGLETEKGRIPVGTDMCSTIEGIFVAGDAAIYPSKTMLIATGFTEAMAAVNSAAMYLDPRAKSQVYSTVIYKYADQ
ncbi:NAD(P)/FAD-dependent oxidoreductase [Halobacillus mangrovi]|uniref:Ferredoxin--NADP reductase n=1 Tax=Halobacillus mangrovi TaxID=402384 RepID=A0A1W6A056_9BACI|nr:NAD(P)/FAD-dependent oxidoreductase [Halobacillus mangrovi]ARI79005.1 ferredoxin-NADP reductase [Halobacillus mangrovi]